MVEVRVREKGGAHMYREDITSSPDVGRVRYIDAHSLVSFADGFRRFSMGVHELGDARIYLRLRCQGLGSTRRRLRDGSWRVVRCGWDEEKSARDVRKTCERTKGQRVDV